MVPELFRATDFIKQYNKEKVNQKLDIDTQATNELELNKLKIFIEDCITGLSKQPKELFKFAYELRKADEADQYSYDYLNGQVQPHVIVDILMANSWNSKTNQMISNKNGKFYLITGSKAIIL